MATQCNSKECSSVIGLLTERIETLESELAALKLKLNVDNGKSPLKETSNVKVNELPSSVCERTWSEVVKGATN